MKKVILITVLSAVSIAGIAQATFGVQVGGNLASAKLEYDAGGTTLKQNNKSMIGFIVGVVAEVPIASSVSFRPELNFIQKGYKFDETQGSDKYTEKATLNYLELPLNFVYNFPSGPGDVFFGIGPSIGYGISGTTKTTSTGDPDEKSDVKFDGKKNDATNDNNAHLKALDLGGDILAGYKLTSGLFFSLGYTFAFTNIIPDDGATLKNRGLALKIGYNFGAAGSSSK